MNNFYYIITLLDTLYGIHMPEDQVEEVGLIAWNLIGNKRCKLHRYVASTDCNNSIQLPCNCTYLEAVTTNFEDFLHVSNIHDTSLPGSFSTEAYIESRKHFLNPEYISGKYVPYELIGDTLYFTLPYSNLNILYKGIVLDENELPELTDKEALAIATYCAYVNKYKEGISLNNANSIKFAEMLRLDWLKRCDAARVPEYTNLNEWNDILDVKNRFDRHIFKKSYKPLR